MAQEKRISRDEQVQLNSAKRKQAMQAAMDRSAATRSAMVNHINIQAVALSEQILCIKMAVRTTALIAAFIPGLSPPDVITPILLIVFAMMVNLLNITMPQPGFVLFV